MPKVYRVRELVGELGDLLSSSYRGLWVEGEVTGCKLASSGHLYFSLKDEAAQLGCVMWANAAQALKFKCADGLKVVARGALGMYPERGLLQFYAEQLEPLGIGALQLAFEQLRDRLRGEGLFELERKRPLPFLPRAIAIVTSPDGAALRDILAVLARRHPRLTLSVFPCRVQGKGAAAEIAAAIARVSEFGRHDVVIVCRGGGSLEDLWAFNEEEVARAIAASRLPVISAVGHETDTTIADFVADRRAPTPSAAAEMVIGIEEELVARVSTGERRLRGWMGALLARQGETLSAMDKRGGRMLLRARLERARARVEELASQVRASPRLALERWRRRFERASAMVAGWPRRAALGARRDHAAALAERLRRSAEALLGKRRGDLERDAQKLALLNPWGILQRGYAVALAGESGIGRVVTDPAAVAPGDSLRVMVRHGEIRARVERRLRGNPADLVEPEAQLTLPDLGDED